MSFSPANITALVIAASFAAGLNIYATVLTLGILARTQWVALPPGLDSLGHTWVIVVCAVMFGIEFIADKIPGFDLICPSRRWSPTTLPRSSRRRCRSSPLPSVPPSHSPRMDRRLLSAPLSLQARSRFPTSPSAHRKTL
jgi:hypothetical protein